MKNEATAGLPVIGWREWIKLTDLELPRIKAKVDSGARSSSLHAFDIEEFVRVDAKWVKFSVHPVQRKSTKIVTVESPVLDMRSVRSSSGCTEHRYVILTAIQLLGQSWEVELTLTDRSQMGFRMLLGREAFRGRFLLDAGSSYYGGKPKRKLKRE